MCDVWCVCMIRAGMGLIVPETKDGRVLFLLPWEGSTIAGMSLAVAYVLSVSSFLV